jgi:hypothetical protein
MSRGGKRTGSGRKRIACNLKKKGIYVKVSPWLAEWLKLQSKAQGVLIEEALIEVHGLELPVDKSVYKSYLSTA